MTAVVIRFPASGPVFVSIADAIRWHETKGKVRVWPKPPIDATGNPFADEHLGAVFAAVTTGIAPVWQLALLNYDADAYDAWSSVYAETAATDPIAGVRRDDCAFVARTLRRWATDLHAAMMEGGRGNAGGTNPGAAE